ncbi:MAG: hypothetical protein EXR72_11045 [Myxococcales bacterium]|nr:hypothetical protein [Myxococcales bacterium]
MSGGTPFSVKHPGGGAKVPPVYKLLFTRDRVALRAHLLRLAALPGLSRLVPTHGRIESDDPAATLRAVAEAL